MNLEHATMVFLVLVFAAAEIYRSLRGVRGVIVGIDDSDFGPVTLPVMAARVKIDGAEEVTATLNCCTACLGRLRVGDRVRVHESTDGYVIDLPWFNPTSSSDRSLGRSPERTCSSNRPAAGDCRRLRSKAQPFHAS